MINGRYLRILSICVASLLLSLMLVNGVRSQAAAAPRERFTVRLSFGHKDEKPTKWDGRIEIDGGQITQLEGWKFLAQDKITSGYSWLIRTDKPVRENQPVGVNGVVVSGSAVEGARLSVSTQGGDFSFSLADLQLGGEVELLEGAVHVMRMPASVKLTDDLRYDDYPSVAVAPDGVVWAVWTSYSGLRDQVRLSKYADGRWYTFTYVPGAQGDVWWPQVAVDSAGKVWVVWAQQIEENWDIYARALEGGMWHKSVRLSQHPGSDANHYLTSDASGNLCVVWQSFRGDNSDIFLATFDGERWSKEVQVTDSPGNDWWPSAAIDSKGVAHIAWDTYRNGNYDIYMRSYDDGKLSDEIAVADTPNAEMEVNVACDAADGVWVAWANTGVNWGKDQGYTVSNPKPGLRLYAGRSISIRRFGNGEAKEPVSNINMSLPQGQRRFCQFPRMLFDKEGRLWVSFRHKGGRRTAQNKTRHYWEEYISSYNGDTWTDAIVLPNSWGRNGSRSDIALAPDGKIWLTWNTDGRRYSNPHAPVVDNVYVGYFTPEGEIAAPVLQKPVIEQVEVRVGHKDETGDLEAIHAYRAIVNGTEKRIIRGDLHRHQEFSFDSGGAGDGSIFGFYRYMIDAAAMDFGASTDHNAGGDYEYFWWLTQKMSDIYYAPERYVPLYGYERSVVYPNGHRNILHAQRNIPVVSFFTKSALRGKRPTVGTGGVLENDTKLLYEEVRKTDGLIISHTSGNRMGTDWRDNDEYLEPVVEIFQGCRTSYEYEGAPKSADKEKDAKHIKQAGYEAKGFVWNAWAKGYRLGTIASSDHGSTHISYAMVYTDDTSRRGILEAIRRRHTYGATDNIVLEYRMGEHFMGDEFSTDEIPIISVKVRGTRKISQIDIIKNNSFAYTSNPNKQEVEFTYKDTKLEPGTSYYYVRIQQEDGQLAWSSPIWVNFRN